MSVASKPIVSALRELATRNEEPLASLAEALIPAADASDEGIDGAACSRVREVISSLAGDSAAKGHDSSAVVEALVRVDTYLGANGHVRVPFATRFAPLAVECAVHAVAEDVHDAINQNEARSAPLFMADKHSLCAMLTLAVGTEGLALWSDRVLSAVIRYRPKRVVFVLGGAVSQASAAVRCLETLSEDLATQNIDVDTVESL